MHSGIAAVALADGNDSFAHESRINKCAHKKEGTEHTSPAREWAEDEELQRLLNPKTLQYSAALVRSPTSANALTDGNNCFAQIEFHVGSPIATANDEWPQDEELQRLLNQKPSQYSVVFQPVVFVRSPTSVGKSTPRDDNDCANDHVTANALADDNVAHESTGNKCGAEKEGTEHTSPARKRVRSMPVDKNECGAEKERDDNTSPARKRVRSMPVETNTVSTGRLPSLPSKRTHPIATAKNNDHVVSKTKPLDKGVPEPSPTRIPATAGVSCAGPLTAEMATGQTTDLKPNAQQSIKPRTGSQTQSESKQDDSPTHTYFRQTQVQQKVHDELLAMAKNKEFVANSLDDTTGVKTAEFSTGEARVSNEIVLYGATFVCRVNYSCYMFRKSMGL